MLQFISSWSRSGSPDGDVVVVVVLDANSVVVVSATVLLSTAAADEDVAPATSMATVVVVVVVVGVVVVVVVVVAVEASALLLHPTRSMAGVFTYTSKTFELAYHSGLYRSPVATAAPVHLPVDTRYSYAMMQLSGSMHANAQWLAVRPCVVLLLLYTVPLARAPVASLDLGKRLKQACKLRSSISYSVALYAHGLQVVVASGTPGSAVLSAWL